MIILLVIIEIALIVFTVATEYFVEAVPFFEALHIPFIWVSVVFGIITGVYIGVKIYVDVNGNRKDKNKKDE